MRGGFCRLETPPVCKCCLAHGSVTQRLADVYLYITKQTIQATTIQRLRLLNRKTPNTEKNTSLRYTMDMRVGFVILFVLGASWACDARHVMELSLSVQEGEPQSLKEFSGNENVCTLCEEFASQALDYISENKTQTEIIGYLHNSCSQLKSFKQQCVTLVDYYAPLFFLEVTSLEPVEFCRKVNLCQQVATFSLQLKEDSCGLCHRTVSEVLVKLKDPDTQLEIIEILLKACNSVENYVKKCKRLVFQYGPLILVNAEEYLEKTDICTALHACNPGTVSTMEASSLDIGSMRADS